MIGNFNSQTGRQWETLFYRVALIEGYWVEWLPTHGAERYGNGSTTHTEMICDAFLIKLPLVPILAEVKSFDSEVVTYSNLELHKKSKQVAFEKLCAADERGIIAGWFVYFRPVNRVVYFPASHLEKLRPRDSISYKVGAQLGPVSGFKIGLVHGIKNDRSLKHE